MESRTRVPVDRAGIHIREARPEDRELILGLVPELLDFGAPPPWRDAQQMIAIDVRVISEVLDGRSPGASILVAEDDKGERLGFIHLNEEEDYYGGACGHVGDVIVAPSARGRGVGKALLAAGERWALERGYRLLTLNVFLANEKARALYEDVGFRAETVRHVKVLD